MKTKLSKIALSIGLTAVLGSATLIAETWSQSIANIPFDFHIKQTTLPAGKYAISYTPENRLMIFRNLENRRSTMVLVHQFTSGSTEDPKVTFQYDGERYTLGEVWFGGTNGGYGPLKGRRDRGESERGMVATVRLLNK